MPYLPGESTASGRDVFLVEGPVTIDVNGQVMTGENNEMGLSSDQACKLMLFIVKVSLSVDVTLQSWLFDLWTLD